MSLELIEVVDKNGHTTRRWKRPEVAISAAQNLIPAARLAANTASSLPELDENTSYLGLDRDFVVFLINGRKVSIEGDVNPESWYLDDEDRYDISELDDVFGAGTFEDLMDHHRAAQRQPALPFVPFAPGTLKGANFTEPLRIELTHPVDLERVTRAGSGMGEANKPSGGLWASTLYCDDDGTVRSEWEGLRGERSAAEDAHITFHSVSVHPEANVLVIDSWADYTAAVDAYPAQFWDSTATQRPDYATMASKGVDAIFITSRGLQECDGWSMPREDGPDRVRSREGYEGVRSWDIPSMVFLNPAAVVIEASGTRSHVQDYEDVRRMR